MTAALTALLPGGPRNARPGAGAPQGDFAQVLERISASEGRDAPAVRPRDRAEAPGVRTPDRTDSPDRAPDRPVTPATGDPADGRTDAPTSGDAAGADATPVELATSAVPTEPSATVPVPLAAVQAVALATVAAPVPPAVVVATVEADGATPAAVPATTAAALPADTATTATTAIPTATSGPVAPVGPAAGSAVQAPVPAPAEGGDGRPVPEPPTAAPGAEPSTSTTSATSTSSATPGDRAAPPAPSAPAVGVATAPPTAVASTPPVAPASAPAPAAAATPLPLAEQLGARLTALTGPGGLSQGRHVLTVPIDPENLGPVRIVAHIGPESVRVELVGATDASREALRGVLTELRRDLAASGLTVDVGPDGGRPEGQQPDGRAAVPWQRVLGSAVEQTDPVPAAPDRPPSRGLDLLA